MRFAQQQTQEKKPPFWERWYFEGFLHIVSWRLLAAMCCRMNLKWWNMSIHLQFCWNKGFVNNWDLSFDRRRSRENSIKSTIYGQNGLHHKITKHTSKIWKKGSIKSQSLGKYFKLGKVWQHALWSQNFDSFLVNFFSLSCFSHQIMIPNCCSQRKWK